GKLSRPAGKTELRRERLPESLAGKLSLTVLTCEKTLLSFAAGRSAACFCSLACNSIYSNAWPACLLCRITTAFFTFIFHQSELGFGQ
ncbi:MAG TPA: hypothetical protein VLS45_00730, partial [Methylomicrobium sp.]|nr:hypothetical protein [Methylomicrobium sp.]